MTKKKKNDEVQCENNAYFERIKVLEKEVESYRADGEKLGSEILSLRRSVSSYKGANTKLSSEIERLRKLGREGDELCEQYVGEKEALSRMVGEKEKVISGLNSQVSELGDKITGLLKELSELRAERDDLSKALDYEQRPWWKKLF